MRLTDEQLRRLAEGLLQDLSADGLLRPLVEEERVLARIEGLIRENLAVEQDLDRQARELLELHLRNAPADVDRQKLLSMIKKKLAEEKGIEL